jgi:hypothetical protein
LDGRQENQKDTTEKQSKMVTIMIKRIHLFVLIILMVFFSGCASTRSSKQQFGGIPEMLMRNDYSSAINQIEAAKGMFYKEKEQALFYLDVGMLYHYNGDFDKSNEALSKAEAAIDELYTKSISKAAVSLLLNDNALDYSGEDYEDVYLNVFKALNYLKLDNPEAAFVEIRRINMKLSYLEQKHKKMADQYNLSKDKKNEFKAGENKFHNSALGRYLSMLLYRADGMYDDAAIDLKYIYDAFQSQSQIYDFPAPKLDNHLNISDQVKANFIVFTGRAPDKKAKTLYIHTEENMIIIGTTDENPRGKQELETLDIINWPGVQKGYHFKFQLPYMEKRESQIAGARLVVDGTVRSDLKLIEDIQNVALETYKIKEPIIYLKTITRTITKGLLSAKGKQEMDKSLNNPLLGFVARTATDLAVDATENADLRISQFFPAKALILEVELEEGNHNCKIEYYGHNGAILWIDDFGSLPIVKNRLNIYESHFLK